jgi:hypothetical protein
MDNAPSRELGFSDCRNHGYSLLGTDNPFHPEEIVLGVKNATRDVGSVDPVVEEREGEEFGKELWMIWRAVENEITDSTDFVPRRGIGGQY